MTEAPVDARLFASLDPLILAGSRCARCDAVAFPAADSCPTCSDEHVSRVELPRTGTLWSWTEQHFEPRAPYVVPSGGFEAYGVGYVHLGMVIVETLLVGASPEWQIDAPMQLVRTRAGGDNLLTFAFEPIGAES